MTWLKILLQYRKTAEKSNKKGKFSIKKQNRLKWDSHVRFRQLIWTCVVVIWSARLCSSSCVYVTYMWAVSHTWYWRHQKFHQKKKSCRSFGPQRRPLSQVEHLALPPLEKTPPEIQSVTFLIRDEPWKQRTASKLCNRSRPLRGKSRVGLSCRRERAMTGLCVVVGGGGGLVTLHYEWC